MRTLRYAHTFLSYCTCADGGGDAACWRWYPLFSKKVRKHSTTFFDECGQTTCFTGPKLIHVHNWWLCFTLLRFWSLFSRFLTLKNVKNGISRTVNFILSFEFPKNIVPFERTRKMTRVYGGNYQSDVSKCMNHSSQKLAKFHVL